MAKVSYIHPRAPVFLPPPLDLVEKTRQPTWSAETHRRVNYWTAKRHEEKIAVFRSDLKPLTDKQGKAVADRIAMTLLHARSVYIPGGDVDCDWDGFFRSINGHDTRFHVINIDDTTPNGESLFGGVVDMTNPDLEVMGERRSAIVRVEVWHPPVDLIEPSQHRLIRERVDAIDLWVTSADIWNPRHFRRLDDALVWSLTPSMVEQAYTSMCLGVDGITASRWRIYSNQDGPVVVPLLPGQN